MVMPVGPQVFVKSLQDTVERVPQTASKDDIARYQQDLLGIFGRNEVYAAMGVSVFTKAAHQTEYSEFTKRLMRKSADIARARIDKTEDKVRVTLRAESNNNLQLRLIESAILRIADHIKCEDGDVELLFNTYRTLLGGDTRSNNNRNCNNKDGSAGKENGGISELAHSYSPDDMRALVDMLCFGDLLIAFIKTVFKHPKTKRRRLVLCMLIATAVEFITHPTASNHLEHKEVRDECKERIVDRYYKLDVATEICSQLPPDSGMAQFGKERRAEKLVNTIETGDGSVALGVLEWVKVGIAGSEGYTLGKSLAKYLAFVEAVAFNNVKLRGKCVAIVHNGFMMTTQSAFEMVSIDIRDVCRDKCVETYGYLVGLHCVEGIMANIEKYYLPNHAIDSSHIRKMVRAIVDNLDLGGPFDAQFLKYVRDFLMLPRVGQILAACGESKRIVRNLLRKTEPRAIYGRSRHGARYM